MRFKKFESDGVLLWACFVFALITLINVYLVYIVLTVRHQSDVRQWLDYNRLHGQFDLYECNSVSQVEDRLYICMDLGLGINRNKCHVLSIGSRGLAKIGLKLNRRSLKCKIHSLNILLAPNDVDSFQEPMPIKLNQDWGLDKANGSVEANEYHLDKILGPWNESGELIDYLKIDSNGLEAEFELKPRLIEYLMNFLCNRVKQIALVIDPSRLDQLMKYERLESCFALWRHDNKWPIAKSSRFDSQNSEPIYFEKLYFVNKNFLS